MFDLGRPRSIRNHAVGLDIGSRMVKYLHVTQSGLRIEIEEAGSFEVPQGTVVDGVVVDRRTFARTLKRHVLHHTSKETPVTFSIPSSLATLRWLALPKMPPEDLREAARFRVKRHLPFPVSNAYLEVSQPDVPEYEGEVQSLVVAVQKPVVDSRAEALVAAGLQPIRAELEAQAILRVVERRLSQRSALWRDASLTIIDVGGTNTHMYVVQNQRLQFIRGVKFGSDLFVQAVMNALEVSGTEASDLLDAPGTSLSPEGIGSFEVPQGAAIVDLSGELDKLTREFLRLLRYFRSLHPERSYAGILDHVVVCGGLVGLRGFAEYLERQLGLRVERARPIAGMLAHFDRETFANIANRQEAFTIATGLALSDSAIGEGARKSHAERDFAWTRYA